MFFSFRIVYRTPLDKQKTLNFARFRREKKTLEEFAIDTPPPGTGISGNKHVSQNFQHAFIFVIGAQRMTL